MFEHRTVATDHAETSVSEQWKVEAKTPPPRVQSILEKVVEDRSGRVSNVALVVGPHAAEAISWLTSLAGGPERGGARIEVLSAASLFKIGGDLPSLRRWLLSQEGSKDDVFMVLLRPTEWFVTEDAHKSDLPGLLHQVVDRCQWTRCAGSLAFISILSAPPTHAWQNAFEDVISLETELGVAAAGYRSPNLEALEAGSEVKEWLQEVQAQAASGPGKAVPYSIALVGPSASGKTSLLAALKTLPMKVLPMSIPALINAGVGDTHLAVRRHFERAQLLQPSCVTLDDADELFRSIQDQDGRNHGVSDLLAELVQMLDQFCSPRLVFIATCTHQEMLPAVLTCRLHFIQLNERSS